jgi:hypothetical protein
MHGMIFRIFEHVTMSRYALQMVNKTRLNIKCKVWKTNYCKVILFDWVIRNYKMV